MNSEDIAVIVKWAKETDLEEITYKDGEDGFSFCEIWHEERRFNFISSMSSINSPCVGIFRNSLPGRTLNISEGDEVKKGDVLGYVEILGEYKEIISPYDAIVVRVCLKDGDCADFNVPVFFVEKR